MKKNRIKDNAFLVEGAKSVLELLNSPLSISFLVATQSFLEENAETLKHFAVPQFCAKINDIERSGSLNTNNSAIAVAKIPPNEPLHITGKNFLIALDEVRDPGNLGTIIRVADWYGIPGIVLSDNCVDPYNPKVIASSMGSFVRVGLYQTDLPSYLAKTDVTKVAATMDGANLHQTPIDGPAIIILGNESSGLSEKVISETDFQVSIPRFGKAESLNVAMAASIICDNLFRA